VLNGVKRGGGYERNWSQYSQYLFLHRESGLLHFHALPYGSVNPLSWTMIMMIQSFSPLNCTANDSRDPLEPRGKPKRKVLVRTFLLLLGLILVLNHGLFSQKNFIETVTVTREIPTVAVGTDPHEMDGIEYIETNSTVTDNHYLDSNTSGVSIVPNFLLAGAPKAGTTAVADWLFSGNFGICAAQKLKQGSKSRTFQKEVHFFDVRNSFKRGVKYYSNLYSHCSPADIIMDATPGYGVVPTRIRDFYGSRSFKLSTTIHGLKVIMILREPVSRELSWYNHKKDMFLKDKDRSDRNAFWFSVVKNATNGTTYTFEEYVDQKLLMESPLASKINEWKSMTKASVSPVGIKRTDRSKNLQSVDQRWETSPWKTDNTTRGRSSAYLSTVQKSLYSIYLEKWFEFMPRDQLLILSYDELTNDPGTTRKRIKDFLGLPHNEHQKLTKVNTHSSSSKTTLPSCRSQQKLEGVFRNFNKALYDLMERNAGPPMEQRPFPQFDPLPCKE